MLIETKEQFSAFADNFTQQLYNNHGFRIKSSKCRELLSRMVGAENHNQLISKLPLDEVTWLKPEAIRDLTTDLSERFGFNKSKQLESLISQSIKLTSPPPAYTPPAIDEPPIDRFMPVSIKDFQDAVANIAIYLKQPNSKCREFLLLAYGWDSFDELSKAIEMKTQPGLFGQGVLRFDMHGNEVSDSRGVSNFHRDNRLVWAANKVFIGTDWQAWRVRDMGLYEWPEDHMACMAQLTLEGLVERHEVGGELNTIDDYAHVALSSQGEAYLAFTKLGSAVFERTRALCVNITNAEEFGEVLQQLTDMVDAHPANPWPKAILLEYVMRYLNLGHWDEKISHRQPYGFDLEYPQDAMRRGSLVVAHDFYDIAEAAVNQFKSLLGEHKFSVPHHKLASGDLYDHFYWPATLYNAGVIALYCDENKKAKQWLGWNFRLVEDDSFGARDYLSTLAIINGSPKISRYQKSINESGVWGNLAFAMEAAAKEDKESFIEIVCSLLPRCWTVLDFFKHVPGRDTLTVNRNKASRATIDEFFFRLDVGLDDDQGGSRARVDAATRWFRAVCTDPAVRQETIKLHRDRTEVHLDDRKRESISLFWEPDLSSLHAAIRQAVDLIKPGN